MPRKGQKHTEETKKRIRESERGKIVSVETKLKQKEARLRFIKNNPILAKEYSAKAGKKLKGKKQSEEVVNRVKEKWKNPEYREMRLKQMLKFKTPNRPERKMIEIIEKHKLPFEYVGDGSLIIKGFNPDFANCNGRKELIEVFGDYWHNRKDWKKRDKERLEIFASLGYKTLVFWEHEIVDRRNTQSTLTEEEIVRRIKSWARTVGLNPHKSFSDMKGEENV
jgi:very-short-patch-repair endonuclease